MGGGSGVDDVGVGGSEIRGKEKGGEEGIEDPQPGG